ncbi:MAG: phenylalanine--tRNA ligase subunit alpha [Legionellales bacterium]|jgi:phenylalanyl-tRNA synthetase alpha chain|nr:phenylalanine--tRNA ligase subunit alpha [Legionellales bacterium]
MDNTVVKLISNAKEIESLAIFSIEKSTSLDDLEQIRVINLGKSGSITTILKKIATISSESKNAFGKELNIIKNNIKAALDTKKIMLEQQHEQNILAKQTLDITLPGVNPAHGTYHPVSMVIEDLKQIFASYGFSSVTGSEIEDDFHNFTALNISPLHPARDMHDTFYFSADRLLRTHTSPAQIHTMQAEHPPLRMISLGKVYRCDSDPTHSPMFHQLEGLVVSENANFLEMKALLDDFFKSFFEKDVAIRFRPSYFPFTEPSAEVDIKMPGSDNWLEVMGCGMVHPNVFKHVGIDSAKYTGYAFGVGIDRLAMLKYGIDDLRSFFENDIDFLKQF